MCACWLERGAKWNNKNTVKKFTELNSKNKNIIAVVGPCIKNKSYEVKNDFFEKFICKK